MTEISKEDIEEFLGKPLESINKDITSTTETTETSESDLPVDPLASLQTQTKIFDTDGITKESIQVSDIDKVLFLKSLLNDTPLELDIPLLNNSLVIRIRARDAHAQCLAMTLVDNRANEEQLTNLLVLNTWIQQYGLALMITAINTKAVDYAKVNCDDNLATAKTKLDAVVHRYYKDIGAKWDILIKAIKIFETKRAKLQDAILDENFWMGIDLD